jgi:hypothetical protein
MRSRSTERWKTRTERSRSVENLIERRRAALAVRRFRVRAYASVSKRWLRHPFATFPREGERFAKPSVILNLFQDPALRESRLCLLRGGC